MENLTAGSIGALPRPAAAPRAYSDKRSPEGRQCHPRAAPATTAGTTPSTKDAARG